VFAVIDHLQTSAGGCSLCGEQKPPYLVAGIMTPLVGTAEGPKRIPGEFAICIGTEANPGCLDTALGVAGGVGPHARRKQEQHVAAQFGQRDRKVQQLQGELRDALANQQKVVALDDVLAALGGEAA
jgi:hypothetical protein